MIFLYIYLSISVLNLILTFLEFAKIGRDIHIALNDIGLDDIEQAPKMDLLTTLSVILLVLRIVIICCMPIYNIGVFYDLVFKHEALEKDVLDRLLIIER